MIHVNFLKLLTVLLFVLRIVQSNSTSNNVEPDVTEIVESDLTEINSTSKNVEPDVAEIDSLICPFDDEKLCWRKCCFANQLFYLDRLSCGQTNETNILQQPDIFSIL
jgi:hypothetical protein